MSSLLVFNRVYRLEIQSVILVFSAGFVNYWPFNLFSVLAILYNYTRRTHTISLTLTSSNYYMSPLILSVCFSHWHFAPISCILYQEGCIGWRGTRGWPELYGHLGSTSLRGNTSTRIWTRALQPDQEEVSSWGFRRAQIVSGRQTFPPIFWLGTEIFARRGDFNARHSSIIRLYFFQARKFCIPA